MFTPNPFQSLHAHCASDPEPSQSPYVVLSVIEENHLDFSSCRTAINVYSTEYGV
jgi:hypothetical protein